MSYVDAAKKRNEDRLDDVQKQQSKGKPLQPLQIGDVVRVQDPITKLWDTKARVIAVREHGRSYLLKKQNCVFFVRNRKFIKLWKGREPEDGQDLPPVNTPNNKFVPRRSPRIAESKKNKIDMLGYNSEVASRPTRSISSHSNTDTVKRLTGWTMSRKVQDPEKIKVNRPREMLQSSAPRAESLRSADQPKGKVGSPTAEAAVQTSPRTDSNTCGQCLGTGVDQTVRSKGLSRTEKLNKRMSKIALILFLETIANGIRFNEKRSPPQHFSVPDLKRGFRLWRLKQQWQLKPQGMAKSGSPITFASPKFTVFACSLFTLTIFSPVSSNSKVLAVSALTMVTVSTVTAWEPQPGKWMDNLPTALREATNKHTPYSDWMKKKGLWYRGEDGRLAPRQPEYQEPVEEKVRWEKPTSDRNSFWAVKFFEDLFHINTAPVTKNDLHTINERGSIHRTEYNQSQTQEGTFSVFTLKGGGTTVAVSLVCYFTFRLLKLITKLFFGRCCPSLKGCCSCCRRCRTGRRESESGLGDMNIEAMTVGDDRNGENTPEVSTDKRRDGENTPEVSAGKKGLERSIDDSDGMTDRGMTFVHPPWPTYPKPGRIIYNV